MVFHAGPPFTGGRSQRLASGAKVDLGFNPRPPSLAGDPPNQASLPRCKNSFQSAPAITGGRSTDAVVTVLPGYCFNPRPPSLAGDPIWQDKQGRTHAGFNPRPPSLAGDPTLAFDDLQVVVVSIRARHHWRAIRHCGSAIDEHHKVSIRARHHWRAIPTSRSAPLAEIMVSIRARHHWRAIRS